MLKIRLIIVGSPPQVRGKLYKRLFAVCRARITPAGAGKTIARLLFLPVVTDHPRRCGENPSICNFECRPQGSPPQVRGKPRCASRRRYPQWITPAGAGKTPRSISPILARWDHPRRCGENIVPFDIYIQRQGSPPQVRGKLCFCC